MSTGPLRRATGVLGLLVLVPVVVQFATGAISAEEAALRALAVAIVTLAVGNLVSSVVRATLRRFEHADGATAGQGSTGTDAGAAAVPGPSGQAAA